MRTRANSCSDSDSNSSRFIRPDTSTSFMKHSMLSGMADELDDMSFLSFSHSARRRRRARVFEYASTLG